MLLMSIFSVHIVLTFVIFCVCFHFCCCSLRWLLIVCMGVLQYSLGLLRLVGLEGGRVWGKFGSLRAVVYLKCLFNIINMGLYMSVYHLIHDFDYFLYVIIPLIIKLIILIIKKLLFYSVFILEALYVSTRGVIFRCWIVITLRNYRYRILQLVFM
jgi:hypothetical protein